MTNESPEIDRDAKPVYRSYSHMNGAATFDFPDHWQTREDPEQPTAIEICSTELPLATAMVMAIPVTLDVAQMDQHGETVNVYSELLKQAGGTDCRESNLMVYKSVTANTEDGCHSWITGHQDLIFAIQIHYPDEFEHIYRPLFERLLTSFRIHRQAEYERRQLTTKLLTRIDERLPSAGFKLDDGLITNGDMQVGVDNLAARIQRDPSSEDELIEEVINSVAEVLSQSAALGNESWEDVRSKILPMIRPDSIVHSTSRSTVADEPDDPSAEIVATPWLANLVVCYAIDSATSLRMINRADVDRWEVDTETLHALAVENLAAEDLPDLVGAMSPEGKLAVGMFGGGGISSKSSYVLHPELGPALRDKFKHGYWIALPSRDAMVVFCQASHNKANLLGAVSHDFNTTDNALSDRLFEQTPDGFILA